MFVDEFRTLLKAHVDYSEEHGEWDSDALREVARLAKVREAQVESWINGTARPAPDDERTLIILLNGLKNFKSA